MFKDKYDRNFRVADYKAFPNPDIQSETHKTNPYSLLDNPTGISVKEGETLVVMVGDTHGQNIGKYKTWTYREVTVSEELHIRYIAVLIN